MKQSEYDRAYRAGQEDVAGRIATELAEIVQPKNSDGEYLREERRQAILVLRRLCEECGDNKWDDSLHLADIIEKHLAKFLID